MRRSCTYSKLNPLLKFQKVLNSRILLHRTDEIEQSPAFLEPGERIVDHPAVTDHALHIDNQLSCALNDLKELIEPVLLIYLPVWIGKNRKWQLEDLHILAGFIHWLSQDQEDLAVDRLEFFIEPAQLAGMTATLNSIVFPDEKQDHIVLAAVLRQMDGGPVP